MSYERKLAPDQPAANDPQYRDAVKRYETTELEDVQTTIGVIDGLRERIAELDAEYDTLADELTTAKRLNGQWMDKRTEAVIRAEQAEAELHTIQVAHDIWLDRATKAEAELAELKPMERFQHGVTTCPSCHAIMRWEQGEVVEWAARAEEGGE